MGMGIGMGPGGASGGFAIGGFSVAVGADMVLVEVFEN
jgi:3-deoxy-D-arabino-heptulosonate 7-phosphate (DAHP) synthase